MVIDKKKHRRFRNKRQIKDFSIITRPLVSLAAVHDRRPFEQIPKRRRLVSLVDPQLRALFRVQLYGQQGSGALIALSGTPAVPVPVRATVPTGRDHAPRRQPAEFSPC